MSDVETTAEVYFHISNGGVTFSVERRPEGKYGNGPHLCVKGASYSTQMLHLDLETAPESLRVLGHALLEAAHQTYPRVGSEALGARDETIPHYEAWRWVRGGGFASGTNSVERMLCGERIEEIEEARAEEEKTYFEKSERLQQRLVMLQREVERAELELTKHRRQTPKIWKRREGDAWVDHEPRVLARLQIAQHRLCHRGIEGSPEEHLATLFGLIECDEPWQLSLFTWQGRETESWESLEKALVSAAEPRGWIVECGVNVREHPFIRVTEGLGTVEIRRQGRQRQPSEPSALP